MTDMLTLPGPEAVTPSAGRRVEHTAGDRLLVCKRVQQVTRDMKTFVFGPVGPIEPVGLFGPDESGAQADPAGPGGWTAPRDPGLFPYDPGQHLVFTFDIDGQVAERRYSICSPPSRPSLVAITVKRVPGGLVSNWLHDHLRTGDTVRAQGPFGQFSMVRHPAPAYLFLSGGSGITPLMSMTRTLYDLASAGGRRLRAQRPHPGGRPLRSGTGADLRDDAERSG